MWKTFEDLNINCSHCRALTSPAVIAVLVLTLGKPKKTLIIFNNQNTLNSFEMHVHFLTLHPPVMETELSVQGPVRVSMHTSSLHKGLVWFFWSFPAAGSHFYCLWVATSCGLSPPEQKHQRGIWVGPNCSCWRKCCWETSETPSFYFRFPCDTQSPGWAGIIMCKVHEVLNETVLVISTL